MKKYAVAMLMLFIPTLVQATHNKVDDGFILITTLHNEKNEERLFEYMLCLKQNLQLPIIEKIHILYNTSFDDTNIYENKLLRQLVAQDRDVVTVTPIDAEPSFQLCFSIANEYYANKKIIIAHANIFFNRTLYALYEYDVKNSFFALTCWNASREQILFDHIEAAQRAWIFHSPIRRLEDCSYRLTSAYGGNYVALQAQRAGLEVTNPSRTIQACRPQLHESKSNGADKPIEQIFIVAPTTLRR